MNAANPKMDFNVACTCGYECPTFNEPRALNIAKNHVQTGLGYHEVTVRTGLWTLTFGTNEEEQ